MSSRWSIYRCCGIRTVQGGYLPRRWRQGSTKTTDKGCLIRDRRRRRHARGRHMAKRPRADGTDFRSCSFPSPRTKVAEALACLEPAVGSSSLAPILSSYRDGLPDDPTIRMCVAISPMHARPADLPSQTARKSRWASSLERRTTPPSRTLRFRTRRRARSAIAATADCLRMPCPACTWPRCVFRSRD